MSPAAGRLRAIGLLLVLAFAASVAAWGTCTEAIAFSVYGIAGLLLLALGRTATGGVRTATCLIAMAACLELHLLYLVPAAWFMAFPGRNIHANLKKLAQLR